MEGASCDDPCTRGLKEIEDFLSTAIDAETFRMSAPSAPSAAPPWGEKGVEVSHKAIESSMFAAAIGSAAKGPADTSLAAGGRSAGCGGATETGLSAALWNPDSENIRRSTMREAFSRLANVRFVGCGAVKSLTSRLSADMQKLLREFYGEGSARSLVLVSFVLLTDYGSPRESLGAFSYKNNPGVFVRVIERIGGFSMWAGFVETVLNWNRLHAEVRSESELGRLCARVARDHPFAGLGVFSLDKHCLDDRLALLAMFHIFLLKHILHVDGSRGGEPFVHPLPMTMFTSIIVSTADNGQTPLSAFTETMEWLMVHGVMNLPPSVRPLATTLHWYMQGCFQEGGGDIAQRLTYRGVPPATYLLMCAPYTAGVHRQLYANPDLERRMFATHILTTFVQA